VTVNDGFADCASTVPVKIQRFRDDRWRIVDTTRTDAEGTYRQRIPVASSAPLPLMAQE
jgi:5-hydroxyisourate hydrolase-like protein (transthyretin family)